MSESLSPTWPRRLRWDEVACEWVVENADGTAVARRRSLLEAEAVAVEDRADG